MGDIFVSYARSDRLAAEAIVTALAAQGWSVWWDRNMVPGRRFDIAIEEQLQRCSCVIVLWSRASVQSDWVICEANEARIQRKLIPIFIEDATVPLPFRMTEAVRLVDWSGSADHPEFERLSSSIENIVMSRQQLPATANKLSTTDFIDDRSNVPRLLVTEHAVRSRLRDLDRGLQGSGSSALSNYLDVYMWIEPPKLRMNVESNGFCRVYFAATNHGYFSHDVSYALSMRKEAIRLGGLKSGAMHLGPARTGEGSYLVWDYCEALAALPEVRDDCECKWGVQTGSGSFESTTLVKMQTAQF